jgi:RNA polymerase sigma-70 factor (ECF subfamily)
MVYSVAYHFLRNSALAEEIAQDIFLDLFRNLRTLQSQPHVIAWLRRSTINRCIDQSRKRAYRYETPFSKGNEPADADHYPDVFAHEAVRRQVAGLPEDQRAAIILRYGEGLMPEEIAELLNTPVNSVKSRLARALQTLRRKLAPTREMA